MGNVSTEEFSMHRKCNILEENNKNNLLECYKWYSEHQPLLRVSVGVYQGVVLGI